MLVSDNQSFAYDLYLLIKINSIKSLQRYNNFLIYLLHNLRQMIHNSPNERQPRDDRYKKNILTKRFLPPVLAYLRRKSYLCSRKTNEEITKAAYCGSGSRLFLADVQQLHQTGFYPGLGTALSIAGVRYLVSWFQALHQAPEA